MQVIPTTYTIVEYCEQMKANQIIVNRDYQRSNQVWPPRARSYLIETILLGFPVPKFSVYQRTDVKKRQTVKEIVDGQQRSQAILQFFDDDFRISGKSPFANKKFSQLDDEYKTKFLEYQINVDLFISATPADIREVFRRINSYNIPLNNQEKRHSTYQGEFKWFIVDMSSKYSQLLKDLGIFSESQLNRMADAVLLTEIIMAMESGIPSAYEPSIDKFYREHDSEESFEESPIIAKRLEEAFNWILEWQPIHETQLMKSYNIYSLILAIMHTLDPINSLQKLFSLNNKVQFQNDIVLTNLSALAEALEQPELYPQFKEYVDACSSSTNRLKQREARFVYLCRALQPHLI